MALTRRTFLAGITAAGAAGAAGAVLAGCASSAEQEQSRALDALAERLDGELLRPGSPPFAEENMPANDDYEEITPLAIAMCASPADVETCVRWCRDNGIQPVVRSGGHNYIGASTTTGLLIKVSHMNGVDVEPATGRMTIGGGALNRNLLESLRGGGWMLPIGTCPGVGVAGLVLGGGIGDNSRWGGMTCDHLVETEIVLASGERVIANERENAELFWALRGGAGGNFGINTSFTFQLIRIPRPVITVWGVRVAGHDEMVAAWSAFDRLMIDAPPELSGFTTVSNSLTLGDRYPQLTIDGCFQGDAASARELLEPVFAAARPQDNIFGEFDFWSAQINYLAVPPLPKHGLAEAARFTRTPVAPDALSNLIDRVVAGPGGSEDANCEVRMMCWSGGAVNLVPSDATAYVHRGSHNLLRPAIWWADQPESMVRDLQQWQEETFAFVSQHAEDGSFVNWPYARLQGWEQAYYGDNFNRLVAVKNVVDPDNIFRYAQSIPTV